MKLVDPELEHWWTRRKGLESLQNDLKGWGFNA